MFKQRFINLCVERNEAPSMVLMKLGLSSAAFSKWTDETVPRKTTLTKIANYFGITIEEYTLLLVKILVKILVSKKEAFPPPFLCHVKAVE